MGIDRYLSDMPWATISQITTASGAGRFAFVQGQLALDENWELSHGPIAEQTKMCFAHISDALSKAGGTLEHILKLTIYMTDIEQFPEVNAARAELFPEGKLPVSTAVEISALYGGGEIEIEAFAFIPDAA
ncbi:MAG: RidA family protein [Patulibacter sp.]